MGKPNNPRKVDDQSALAVARSLRTSPRKLNLVAQMIRGKSAAAALVMLSFSPRRIAKEVKKVLQSAIANAENNHQLDIDRLVVVEATVGNAFVMRRMRPRAKGRGAPIQKPFSSLRVVVRETEEVKKEDKKAAKSQPKKPAAKSEAKPAAQAAKKKD
jgi:large subunit ribosomal protein L22